jgi:hypothetical protein
VNFTHLAYVHFEIVVPYHHLLSHLKLLFGDRIFILFSLFKVLTQCALFVGNSWRHDYRLFVFLLALIGKYICNWVEKILLVFISLLNEFSVNLVIVWLYLLEQLVLAAEIEFNFGPVLVFVQTVLAFVDLILQVVNNLNLGCFLFYLCQIDFNF